MLLLYLLSAAAVSYRYRAVASHSVARFVYGLCLREWMRAEDTTYETLSLSLAFFCLRYGRRPCNGLLDESLTPPKSNFGFLGLQSRIPFTSWIPTPRITVSVEQRLDWDNGVMSFVSQILASLSFEPTRPSRPHMDMVREQGWAGTGISDWDRSKDWWGGIWLVELGFGCIWWLCHPKVEYVYEYNKLKLDCSLGKRQVLSSLSTYYPASQEEGALPPSKKK